VHGDLAPRLGEYGLGDTALVNIKDNWFVNGISTTMRILSIGINPTESVELVNLTMSPTIEDVM
jgi:hypothetical protein